MDADEELPNDELPRGFTPIWIQPPGDATNAEKLERVKEFIGQKTDVMVLPWTMEDQEVDWCREQGWNVTDITYFTGCEARCVVVLDDFPICEAITRAISQLIIVTNRYILY